MKKYRVFVYAVIAVVGIARMYEAIYARELAAQPQPLLCIPPPYSCGIPTNAAVRITE